MNSMTDVRIAHYDNQVPPFVEAEIDRLYGSVFSSLVHLRLHRSLDGASTYVARKGGQVSAIFLFRREKRMVRVINEGMTLDEEEVERFADYIFTVFDSVGVIVFHSVLVAADCTMRPCQRIACGEDIAAELPDSVEAYLSQLGAATRKNIRRHGNRIERAFPSFQFRIQERHDVDERHVREIIAFNHARMAEKGKVSTIDETRTWEILQLVRERGFVTTALIDGRVCGGAITVRLGDSFVSLVNAHDPQYDDYRLGTICCFRTICACIERGGRRFDFLWGRCEYKTALLGEYHELFRFLVYRSRLQLVRNAGTALQTAMAGQWRAARLRLAAIAAMADHGREGQGANWLARGLRLLREMKRRMAGRDTAQAPSVVLNES